ncbi:hypothetical protein PSTG_08759 [Puccinia striiformis f. sp. tritici PST-78]|uniref:DNA helicase Pif1-like 2B domain-containing protein n=1 Tax=Puccinia striiformis f. sp. tritici PST-78 TaxID=1165861 RepID=A0A0L0VFW6_9BASI|nr:hypothetical protein PSTG_08759 [Puccinia striiformis f. sp. tritici PST-78]
MEVRWLEDTNKNHHRFRVWLLKMDMVGRRLAAAYMILWDEAVSTQRHSIEAVNKSLQLPMDNKKPFGGKSEHATLIKSSSLWPPIKTFSLKENMHLSLGLQGACRKENEDFARNIMAIGEGLTQHKDLVQVEVQGVNVAYDDKRVSQPLLSLTPLNADAQSINVRVLDCLTGEEILSHSIDWPDKEAADCLTEEGLNKLAFAGFPDHKLSLKAGIPVVLLRNLNVSEGLWNGTRLLVLRLTSNALEARVLTGPFKGRQVSIPKITLFHEGNTSVKVPFYLYQFPAVAAFAMTINKSQGQSMKHVAVVLISQVFAHGQLYIALLRVRDVCNLLVVQMSRFTRSGSIVFL